MSQVRFQLLFAPATARPPGMHVSQASTDESDSGTGAWYFWRLMGANNRELGRSARSYSSYPGARRAVRHLQQHAGRLTRMTVVDPATGRWGWRLDLDDAAVAVSGRWYERDHDSRQGMDKFINLVRDAELADGVLTLHERRRNVS